MGCLNKLRVAKCVWSIVIWSGMGQILDKSNAKCERLIWFYYADSAIKCNWWSYISLVLRLENIKP